jgi:hypothetical protein
MDSQVHHRDLAQILLKFVLPFKLRPFKCCFDSVIVSEDAASINAVL